MARIAPLKGVRYDSEKAGCLEDLITPPYDIINKNAEKSYISRNPHNIIRLDITKDPGQATGREPGRYTEVAALLADWLERGILIRDDEQALYPYDISYRLSNGERKIRKGFVCLTELVAFEKEVVKPHEQTFKSVIQDRLELTRHCKAQFSQVFSLFTDEKNSVIEALSRVKGSPIAEVTDADGCSHKLWKVTDPDTISCVQKIMQGKPLYIADGHHRYTTALAYRDELREKSPDFDPRRPENHIMMYLCPMEDEGLSILPTHRLVTVPAPISMAQLLERLQRLFFIQEITGYSREILLHDLLERMDEVCPDNTGKNRTRFGLYHPGEDRGCILSLRDKAIDALSDEHPRLQELDVVVLSSLIIENVLGLDYHQCEEQNLVTFYSDALEALDIAVKNSALDEDRTPLLFLMNPTRVEQVKRVADEGLIMPHKSTFFYPKIVTGLVMNKLIETERIDWSDNTPDDGKPAERNQS